MISTSHIIAAIEAKADETGLAPSTVGERTGQGGQFYARLKKGSRVWPETAQSVMEKISQISKAPKDISTDVEGKPDNSCLNDKHGNAIAPRQVGNTLPSVTQ